MYKRQKHALEIVCGTACELGKLLIIQLLCDMPVSYTHLYGREGARKMMDEYQHSLENMNNAAVEYIRGISVVKAFKQTVYSFHRLHETIKEYTLSLIHILPQHD